MRITNTIKATVFLSVCVCCPAAFAGSGHPLPAVVRESSHIRGQQPRENDALASEFANALGAEARPAVVAAGDYIEARRLVAAAVKRAGSNLLFVGPVKSADAVLSMILKSPPLHNDYHGDLMRYVNDLPNMESAAFCNFLDIIGNRTSSWLMRHPFQLFYLKKLVSQRTNDAIEENPGRGVTLEVFSMGVSDGRELISAAAVILDAVERSHFGRIKVVLRGVDIDIRQIRMARLKLQQGYSIEDVGMGDRGKAAARLDYINSRLEEIRQWIAAGRMSIEFENRNLLDASLREYIQSADFVFLNHVLYQLSYSARLEIINNLLYMKPGAVLFNTDVALNVSPRSIILSMDKSADINGKWQRHFSILAENKGITEVICQRVVPAQQGEAVAAGAAGIGYVSISEPQNNWQAIYNSL